MAYTRYCIMTMPPPPPTPPTTPLADTAAKKKLETRRTRCKRCYAERPEYRETYKSASAFRHMKRTPTISNTIYLHVFKKIWKKQISDMFCERSIATDLDVVIAIHFIRPFFVWNAIDFIWPAGLCNVCLVPNLIKSLQNMFVVYY